MASRVFCRRKGSGGDYCVTSRDDKLVLTLPDDNDPYQIWHKQKCDEGFNLVNKYSGNMEIEHYGVGDQLRMIELAWFSDSSSRWTEMGDFGDGFTSLRPLRNTSLGMDAWNGIIFDGTIISLYPSAIPSGVGENAQWKLVRVRKSKPKHVPTPAPVPAPKHVPIPAPAPAPKQVSTPAPAPPPVYKQPSSMIYCLAGDAQYCVAIQAGKLVLANPNPQDPTQQWYKDDSQNTKAGSFMLVNKSNFQAVKQFSTDQPLQLVDRPNNQDGSLQWTESETDGYGYSFVVTVNNNGLAMDAPTGSGKYVSFSKNLKGANQKWKFVP